MHIAFIAVMLFLSAQQPEIAEMLVQKVLERHVADMEVFKTLSYDKITRVDDLFEGKEKEKRKETVKITIAKLFLAGRYGYEFEPSENPNRIRVRFYPENSKAQPGPSIEPDMSFKERQLEEGLNQVINKLEGYLLIDRETLGIIGFEATLRDPLRVKVMTFRIMHIRYEQIRIFDIWTPRKVEVTFKFDDVKWFARLFISKTYERNVTVFENYQRRPQ